MRISNFVSVAAILLLTQFSAANTWYDRGNGGLVIECQNQEPEVLDIYEARLRHLFAPKFPFEKTWKEKAQVMIARIKTVDAGRFALYSRYLKQFESEMNIIDGDLLPTPDAGLVTVPAGCSVKQAVFQREPSVFNRARYVVSEKLWNKLDENNKASLALHEIIYRDFIEAKMSEISSERVRYFNGLLHANIPGDMTLQKYLELLHSLKFSDYSYFGVKILVSEPTLVFSSENSLYRATLAAGQTVNLPYLKYYCSQPTYNQMASATFYPSGRMKSLKVVPRFKELTACDVPFFQFQEKNSLFKVSGEYWTFLENGQPEEVQGVDSNDETYEMAYRGLKFSRSVSGNAMNKLETNFVFDKQMNLVGLSLGGFACRDSHSKIFIRSEGYFTATYMTLDPRGQISSVLQSCF